MDPKVGCTPLQGWDTSTDNKYAEMEKHLAQTAKLASQNPAAEKRLKALRRRREWQQKKECDARMTAQAEELKKKRATDKVLNARREKRQWARQRAATGLHKRAVIQQRRDVKFGESQLRKLGLNPDSVPQVFEKVVVCTS
jgi:hypothetical protein